MDTLNLDELIGTFDAAWDEDEQAKNLKSQASAIIKARQERLIDFARDIEVDIGVLTEAYGRYKKLRKKDEKFASSEYYALISAVDEHFAEENEEDEEKEE